MNITIRYAAFSDIPYLYDICLKTGDNGKNAESLFSDPWLLGQYYSVPYLVNDRTLCFVAEENGIPKGYAVAAIDTTAFDEWLETDWLPIMRNRYKLSLLESNEISECEKGLVTTLHENHLKKATAAWLAEYPAHLHIDLLPDLQGKGCGRRLMEALEARLAEKGCPGVHLGVNAGNVQAISFYAKIGFSVREETSWGFFMVKKIH